MCSFPKVLAGPVKCVNPLVAAVTFLESLPPYHLPSPSPLSPPSPPPPLCMQLYGPNFYCPCNNRQWLNSTIVSIAKGQDYCVFNGFNIYESNQLFNKFRHYFICSFIPI